MEAKNQGNEKSHQSFQNFTTLNTDSNYLTSPNNDNNINLNNFSNPFDLKNHFECHKKIEKMKTDFEEAIELQVAKKNLKLISENKEIISLLTRRIGKNEQTISDLKNENFLIREKFEEKFIEYNKVLDDISKNLNSRLPDDLANGISDKIGDLIEDIGRIKIYREDVDNDAYLFLSVALSFTTLPLICGYFYLIFLKSGISFEKRVKFLLSVIASPFLIFPGIATPIIQLFCAWYVYLEAKMEYSERDKLTLQYLKVFMVIFFLFMVARETAQGINNFFCCYFEAKKKTEFFLAGCFLPPLIQIFIAFFILFVSFLLIISTDDPIDLIQNFAAIYILLEFDNFMMNFLRLTKISIFFLYIKENLEKMRKRLDHPEVFSKNLIKKVLVENSLIVNYDIQNGKYKLIFIISRLMVIIALVVFTTIVWIYDIFGQNTNSHHDHN